MVDPLNLNEPSPKPLTTFRVVAIAAIVAFVIGCLPALGTAIIVSQNLAQESKDNGRRTCEIVKEGRVSGNLKNEQNRLNLNADLAIFKTVYAFTPKKVPPGANITQHQLDVYLHAVHHAIVVKQEKILPLTKDAYIPNCDVVVK